MTENKNTGNLDIIRAAISRERLSYAWLLRQLLLRGIEIPKATLSAYLRGDRYGGENADKVIRACIDILGDYEKGLYANKNGGKIWKAIESPSHKLQA